MPNPADTQSHAPAVPDSAREDRLDEVLASYLRAVQRGSIPDRQRLLAEHPDLADELAEFFADQDRFNHAAAPLRAAVSPSRSFLPSEIGPHVVLGEIARGGMGLVLRARHRELGRMVAVKLLLAGPFAAALDVQRFRREAEAVANLDHPHIVPIYEVGEYEGISWFSMKLMQSSLAQHLHKTSRLSSGSKTAPLSGRTRTGERSLGEVQTAPGARISSIEITQRGNDQPGATRFSDPTAAAHLVVQIGRAVHYAHARGILHRDLKPANILLDENGQPHVSDFGLARRVSREADNGPCLTQTGAIVGTPAYMAPEQAAAHGEITVATDVYGLGAILYECLTDKPPFKAATPLETLRLVLDAEPVSPRILNPAVDADLETICLKCLNKEPGKRYGSAADLADDLERYLRGEPILARPVGRLARTARWVKRQPIVAALTAALVLAVAAGFGAVLSQWRRAEANFTLAERQRDEAQLALEEARLARKRADEQTEKHDRARLQADQHAAAAEASFRQAHEVVNEFCTRLSGKLGQVPGAQPLRLKLLESARQYYQSFVKKRGDDPALRLDLARTHSQIAHLSLALGDNREVLQEYRAALVIYRQLYRESPDDPVIQSGLAGALLNVASQQQNLQESLATTDEALRFYRRFLTSHPNDRRLAVGQAILLANRGTRFSNLRRLDEARVDLEAAAQQLEVLLEKYPDNDEVRYHLSSALDNYSGVLNRMREPALALCGELRAHELRMTWASHNPRDPGRQSALAALRWNLAICLRNVGLIDESEQLFSIILTTRRKLAAENPAMTLYQRDLVFSLKHQGAKQLADGRTAQAALTYEEARGILTKHVKLDPKNPSLRKQLMEVCNTLASTYKSLKQRTKEAEVSLQARRLQEELAREEKEKTSRR
jgi:serine/threonine protein kinase